MHTTRHSRMFPQRDARRSHHEDKSCNLGFAAPRFISSSAQQSMRADPLLDRLTGNWTMQGTIAEHETTHDIEAEWVLGHEYLRLHETSRQKNAQGQPAYEAIVFIEWDESSNEYKCLWLDSTGG